MHPALKWMIYFLVGVVALSMIISIVSPTKGPRVAHLPYIQKGVVADKWVGCITEDLLTEFNSAASNKDQLHIAALLASSCMHLQGVSYSVVDGGYSRSRIRVYAGTDSLLVWVPTKAIWDNNY